MIKKILSILLIGLLVMSSMGSACAQSEYYDYTCKIGDEFTTHDVMMAIGDPFWLSYMQLNDILCGCDLIHKLGTRDYDHYDSYWYTGAKVGSKWNEIDNTITSSDYLQLTVDP
jgi:hypothetical protein